MEGYSENQNAINAINKLQNRIIKYYQNLNNSGIWLFLAILGCWSVTDEYIQFLALVVAFMIFSHRLITGLTSFKLFKSEVRDVKTLIENSKLSEDTRKARLYDLEKVERKYMSWTRVIKYIPAYYLSIIFLGFSAAHWRNWF